ncbi:uncharacterized protein [Gossypium hirsutum]|uniref:Uncharacterized protein isoform X2 n=1 Tax=Gossypium hirsutum TaxID=3635 RepID=A0ABM3A4U4_GOSHI|nr:uncharacterized protein LOC121217765 isoform X2 [Gossypium hirsutum]
MLTYLKMPMALCARRSCLFLSYCIHQIVRKSSLKHEPGKKIMEDRSGSSYNLSAELETLQKQHEEKTVKIQELKKRIETVKLRLEQKKKKETPGENKEAFHDLILKYNSLRDEYIALSRDKSRDLNK